MKKISVIRFKPKPECFDEFLANIKERSRERALASPPTHFLMTTDEEIVAIAIRSESELAERAARGVDWLNTPRHLLVEYSEQDRHTIPLTGTMVEY